VCSAAENLTFKRLSKGQSENVDSILVPSQSLQDD
jgi:hypothetical protein